MLSEIKSKKLSNRRRSTIHHQQQQQQQQNGKEPFLFGRFVKSLDAQTTIIPNKKIQKPVLNKELSILREEEYTRSYHSFDSLQLINLPPEILDVKSQENDENSNNNDIRQNELNENSFSSDDTLLIIYDEDEEEKRMKKAKGFFKNKRERINSIIMNEYDLKYILCLI